MLLTLALETWVLRFADFKWILVIILTLEYEITNVLGNFITVKPGRKFLVPVHDHKKNRS